MAITNWQVGQSNQWTLSYTALGGADTERSNWLSNLSHESELEYYFWELADPLPLPALRGLILGPRQTTPVFRLATASRIYIRSADPTVRVCVNGFGEAQSGVE